MIKNLIIKNDIYQYLKEKFNNLKLLSAIYNKGIGKK